MSLMVATRLAVRELRGGISGFRVFLACIALGVGAIAAVGAIRESILHGIGEHGQVVLGGDVSLSMTNIPIGDEERAFIEGYGDVIESTRLRAMATATDGRRTLVELKGVTSLYPLYGAAKLDPESEVSDAVALKDGKWGVLVEQAVLDRTGTGVGDDLRIGEVDYEVRGAIKYEPDRAADAFTLGVRAMVHNDSLALTGLVRLGSLVRYEYRIALPPQTTPDKFKVALEEAFPKAGWRVRDRDNGAPGLRNFISRMSVFLTLAGLTTLVVGGVGVANATTGYMASKREVIATLKCVGARGSTIFQTYLIQVLLLTIVGIAIGMVIGALVPIFALAALQDVLPVPAEAGLYPRPLALGAAYGLLTAIAFAAWPLGRAREVAAASLFRQVVAPIHGAPKIQYIILAGAALAGLAGLALTFSGHLSFTGYFLLGALISFAVLYIIGRAVMAAAARAPRSKHAATRMAIANLHRPGASTPNIVLSLGLGLTLLVAIAQIQANLSAQIRDNLPEDAPAFFFIDVQPDQIDAFEAALLGVDGVREVVRAPMLRAAITKIAGVPVADADVSPEARWAVRGDRGLTYAVHQPAGSEIVEGDWWPGNYMGPAQVSFDVDLARGMGLGVGDTLSFNVMGREIQAEIANLRRINWSTMGLNFSVIFAPGTLERAPHSYLASVRLHQDAEAKVDLLVADSFPNVTAVKVREVLEAVNGLLGDVGMAIRGAASAALIAGLLVLAGAVAAGYHERLRDAVILKVLGATRRNIGQVFLIEYAVLGLLTAILAMILGTLAAYLVMTQVMEADWIWRPEVLVGTAFVGVTVTVLVGFLGTWRALGEKVAPVLRTE